MPDAAPTITPERLALLERSHNMLQKLNGDARTRAPLEAAIKVHYPQVVTEEDTAQRLVGPHLDAFKTEVVAPLTEALKALNERGEREESSRIEQRLTDAFSDLQNSRHFTPEGIEAVKRMMVENSIADPYAAAARFNELNPPPSTEVPGWTPQQWNMESTLSDIDVKGLFANEDVWADKAAATALNEIRLGQAA